jgi:hypothetical protein
MRSMLTTGLIFGDSLKLLVSLHRTYFEKGFWLHPMMDHATKIEFVCYVLVIRAIDGMNGKKPNLWQLPIAQNDHKPAFGAFQ